jgi:hypothetical protein
LKGFVLEFERSSTSPPLDVSVRYNQKGGVRFSVHMYGEETLLSLRDRIAERVSKPSCCIRLLDSQQNAYYESDLPHTTLSELDIKNGLSFQNLKNLNIFLYFLSLFLLISYLFLYYFLLFIIFMLHYLRHMVWL